MLMTKADGRTVICVESLLSGCKDAAYPMQQLPTHAMRTQVAPALERQCT